METKESTLPEKTQWQVGLTSGGGGKSEFYFKHLTANQLDVHLQNSFLSFLYKITFEWTNK